MWYSKRSLRDILFLLAVSWLLSLGLSSCAIDSGTSGDGSSTDPGTPTTQSTGFSGGAGAGGGGGFNNVYTLSFDGSTKYLESATNPITAYPFSISVWVKSTAAVSQTIAGLFKSTATNVLFRITLTSSGIPRIEASNTMLRTGASATAINDGLWHHVVGVFASSSSRILYVDGAQAASSTNSVTFPTTMTNFTIGRNSTSSPGSYFNGEMDEATLWTGALAASDVTELYNAGHPMDPTTATAAANLYSWWRMGDFPGDDPTTVIQDAQGNLSLTATGMTSADLMTDVP